MPGFETYGEEFDFYLNEVMAGRDAFGRRALFEGFIQGASFVCATCGRDFETAGREIDEDDPLLCLQCLEKRCRPGTSGR